MTYSQADMGFAERASSHMLPSDTSLPFFAYGFLKPGEIAYPRIQEFVEEPPVEATVVATLWLRDGLLFLKPPERGRLARGSTDRRVQGSLLRFAPPKADAAYEAIATLEPQDLYRWETADVLTERGREDANVLVGRRPDRGGAEEWYGGEWRSIDDPLFREALWEVERMIADESRSGNSEDLGMFFRKQMAYLLLWSSIERYVSLRYKIGGNNVLAKIRRLAGEDAFQEALREVVKDTRVIYRANDPEDRVKLDPSDPRRSIEYYYQIRSNMAHRGKAAIRDRKIVGDALLELLTIHKRVLAATLSGQER